VAAIAVANCNLKPWLEKCLFYPNFQSGRVIIIYMINFPEGFGSALSKVIANKELSVGLRQISFS
jgi:hypothetical protein